MPPEKPLPYTDTKPVGAADFYTAINATFRFVFGRFGREGLLRYWQDMGSHYFAPVSNQWRTGGLPAVAAYWRAFFTSEPGAEVEVHEGAHEVVLEVRVCPAIHHLRFLGREIVPSFCQHCYFVGDAIAQPAGMALRVKGGAGSCTQRISPANACERSQNLDDITAVL